MSRPIITRPVTKRERMLETSLEVHRAHLDARVAALRLRRAPTTDNRRRLALALLEVKEAMERRQDASEWWSEVPCERAKEAAVAA